MLATVELQVRATTLAASVLASLRQTPRCLPPAIFDLQLQRVRMKSAAFRNSETASFRISREMGSYDQGLGSEYIEGKQVQLAIDVTLDITQTVTIEANPNKLIPAEFSANATIIFDLRLHRFDPPGWVELVYRIHDILPTGVLPPATNLTPDWVKNQLAARLGLTPFKLDLSGLIPSGKFFANAGIAMDSAGTVVAVRAELSGHPSLVNRWIGFQRGNIDPQLGANDWSIVAIGDQLEYTLGDKVWGGRCAKP